MTGDEYVSTVLAKYQIPRGPQSPAEKAATAIAPELAKWAGAHLDALSYSGSYAKGTGVLGVADLDLFISLKADTHESLREIYENLLARVTALRWKPRPQNVSIGISFNGIPIDLVPAKIQAGYQNYHSIYLRKKGTWRQTNIKLQTDKVVDSGRTREIRAIKIWRSLHRLDFPSVYLELFVISALSGRSKDALADNVLYALRAIRDSLGNTRIEDPGNTNNIISDDLTSTEKAVIASAAKQSALQQNWGSIIW
jgi:hypothetical protein